MAKKQDMAARHAAPKKSQRKSRQIVRPAHNFDIGSLPRRAEESVRPVSPASPSPTRTRFRSTVQMLSSDHHYVLSDLKRIAITAVVLVVVMIALTFIVK